jgi:hypothetical protein
MDDVEFLVEEMLNKFLVRIGSGKPVFRIEEEVPGRKAVDLVWQRLVHMTRKSRGVDVDFVSKLGEFTGKGLGGSPHAVDARKVGVGD